MKFMIILCFSLSLDLAAALPPPSVSNNAGQTSLVNGASNLTKGRSNPEYSVPDITPALTFTYLLDRRPAGESGTIIAELAHECGANHALQIETKFAHGHMQAGDHAPEDCSERLCVLRAPAGMVRMYIGHFRHGDTISWDMLADIWMGIADALASPPYERIWETYVLVRSGDDDDPVTWFSQFGFEPAGGDWALKNSSAVNSAVSVT